MIRFFFKLIIFIVVVALVGFYAVKKFPSFREKMIEYADPSVKEKRLINELSQKLDALKDETSEMSVENKNKIINESQKLIEQMNELNQENKNISAIDAALRRFVRWLFGLRQT